MTKPLASLSLDLDNKWSYMKTHGDKGWEEYPSYLNTVVPRILEVLDHLDLKITFFVVGQDAARSENHNAIRSLVEAGHEIGNHSFNHEPWLHLYERQQLEEELTETEKAIEAVTGQIPVGFRGPGYSYSPTLLDCLAERGYLFDASKLPTFIGPLARAYYFFRSTLGRAEREDRQKLFGTLKEGFGTLKPHYWKWSSAGKQNRILEIPVTTMPFFRMPFHMSYLLYLLQYSERLARTYWWLAKSCCRLARVEPSLLLHPLDFMDEQDEPNLAFFPGMKTPSRRKCEFLKQILSDFANRYQVLPMSSYAQELQDRSDLQIKALQLDEDSALGNATQIKDLNTESQIPLNNLEVVRQKSDIDQDKQHAETTSDKLENTCSIK